MKVINLREEGSRIPNLYQYEVIAKMNDHNFTVVRVKDRTLEFHIHPDSDEVFFIVDGKMKLEFRDQTVELKTGEMCRSERNGTQTHLHYRSNLFAD
jgi:mannose-6-phosphate isomerase-like protein (cupin superfamily)